MRSGLRILVVVPARGGSKGVPLKNLHPLAGKPLLAHTAELLQRLPWVDRAVVSTDHLLIRETAVEAGLEVPFMRPEALSGDRIGDVDVLAHALAASEADDGQRYDLVVMLQPTSPLRRAQEVTAAVDKLIKDGLDSVWTVSPTDLKAHPLKQLVVDDHGRLDYFDPRGADIIARQQLAPVYHRNGVAYVVRRQVLEAGRLMGERSGALILGDVPISIDSLADFERAEALLEESTPAHSAPDDTRPRPRKLVVDIDGVIAQARPELDYAAAEPMRDNIQRIKALFDAGCHITLFTARGSGTGRDWSETTRGQLQEWGVRYHELRFGKPAADFYIDDRLVTLSHVLALCGQPDPVSCSRQKSEPNGSEP